jgi:hypothetical protein
MQQRGIPPVLVGRVLRHGPKLQDHHGGVILTITKAARALPQRH